MNVTFNIDIITIAAILSGLWFIVNLRIKPIEKTLQKVEKISDNVKTDAELKDMMKIEVTQHEKECRQERIAQTSSIRIIKQQEHRV